MIKGTGVEEQWDRLNVIFGGYFENRIQLAFYRSKYLVTGVDSNRSVPINKKYTGGISLF
jgi:hypothetical protein